MSNANSMWPSSTGGNARRHQRISASDFDANNVRVNLVDPDFSGTPDCADGRVIRVNQEENRSIQYIPTTEKQSPDHHRA